MQPGIKGLKNLVGSLPTWLSFQEKERVEWLNTMLIQMWPFYDYAICQTIKQIVEPVMEDHRPPVIIKRIAFKKITFGDSPFRIEGVKIEKEQDDELLLLIDFRWAGEANIALAIETPAGSMTPKIAKLVFHGQLRILLKPLLSEIPCFGAVVVSMTKPPVIKFNLDFGALGGSLTAAPVKAFLDPFIRDTLVNLLVWPNRMVVPILEENITGPLTDLYLHDVGLLKVEIIRATGLKKMDTFGKADPMIELFTRPEWKQSTKVKRKTQEPEWNETFYTLLQEPLTQYLRLTMYDIDFFDPTRAIKNINVFKGIKDTVQSKELMGRVAIKLKPFVLSPGIRHENWYGLGLGEWSNDRGPGKGEGQVMVALTYRPFFGLNPTQSEIGLLLVVINRAVNLPPVDGGVSVDPYIKVKVEKQHFYTTVKYKEINPEWYESFEFRHVNIGLDLKLKLYDKNLMIGTDDYLGQVTIPIVDVVESTCNGEQGVLERDFKIEEADSGVLSLKTRFVPYF
eukprot:TRINITY_DN3476_c0_g1_i4.p1 TRINITY_DN3476_c0_g1~~TRINITY_DN3476_c0_g1_i4.p1  ORF type:complete len:510 (+),score=48.64 TRINITY_DN3476_c0_g1_i4:335-1864(+)